MRPVPRPEPNSPGYKRYRIQPVPALMGQLLRLLPSPMKAGSLQLGCSCKSWMTCTGRKTSSPTGSTGMARQLVERPRMQRRDEKKSRNSLKVSVCTTSSTYQFHLLRHIVKTEAEISLVQASTRGEARLVEDRLKRIGIQPLRHF